VSHEDRGTRPDQPRLGRLLPIAQTRPPGNQKNRQNIPTNRLFFLGGHLGHFSTYLLFIEQAGILTWGLLLVSGFYFIRAYQAQQRMNEYKAEIDSTHQAMEGSIAIF
jgi:hypothetical protein